MNKKNRIFEDENTEDLDESKQSLVFLKSVLQ